MAVGRCQPPDTVSAVVMTVVGWREVVFGRRFLGRFGLWAGGGGRGLALEGAAPLPWIVRISWPALTVSSFLM